MTETTTRPSALVRRPARTLRLLASLVAVETLLVGGYLLSTDTTVLSVRYVSYPLVWVNLGVLAVDAVDVPRPTDRRTLAAALVAAAYFAVLAWTAGLVGLGTGDSPSVSLLWAVPGWGPVLLVGGPVSLALVPFEVVGYACLSVLVYGSLVRATAGALSGALGLTTCVSCVGPVVAGAVAGLGGGVSTVVAGAGNGPFAYDLSTALFVVTVCALWYALR